MFARYEVKVGAKLPCGAASQRPEQYRFTRVPTREPHRISHQIGNPRFSVVDALHLETRYSVSECWGRGRISTLQGLVRKHAPVCITWPSGLHLHTRRRARPSRARWSELQGVPCRSDAHHAEGVFHGCSRPLDDSPLLTSLDALWPGAESDKATSDMRKPREASQDTERDRHGGAGCGHREEWLLRHSLDPLG